MCPGTPFFFFSSPTSSPLEYSNLCMNGEKSGFTDQMSGWACGCSQVTMCRGVPGFEVSNPSLLHLYIPRITENYERFILPIRQADLTSVSSSNSHSNAPLGQAAGDAQTRDSTWMPPSFQRLQNQRIHRQILIDKAKILLSAADFLDFSDHL